jgi:hypothetical protein
MLTNLLVMQATAVGAAMVVLEALQPLLVTRSLAAVKVKLWLRAIGSACVWMARRN